MLKFRVLSNNLKVLPVRFCHKENKELRESSSILESDYNYTPMPKEPKFGGVEVRYWNEKAAVKKQKRNASIVRNVHNVVDMLKTVQRIRSFPKTFLELIYMLKKRAENKLLAGQKFLLERERVLKPDLAAAHFIIHLGGSVKFLGKPDWVGYEEKKRVIPYAYIPGLFVESIKAENSKLLHEGLENMRRLKYLKYLSFKNLKTINDWSMDWISKEYHLTLKHLDISGCVNVTYRGLSCFYRFECLETLNVEGIPDTPEFKLACLMLLENMPMLDIQGINLSIPEKIGVDSTEIKQIQGSGSEIQEVKC